MLERHLKLPSPLFALHFSITRVHTGDGIMTRQVIPRVMLTARE